MRAVEDGRGSPNGGALDMTKNISAPKSGKYFMKYLKRFAKCLQQCKASFR